MDFSILLLVLAGLYGLAYVAGRARCLALAGVGGMRILNSLPFYYGSLTAFWCALPSLAVLLIWSLFDGAIIKNMVGSMVPAAALEAAGGNLGLVMNQVQNLAAGSVPADGMAPG